MKDIAALIGYTTLALAVCGSLDIIDFRYYAVPKGSVNCVYLPKETK